MLAYISTNKNKMMKKSLIIFYLFIVALLGLPSIASAYIGPGAGFAFFSSFFILLATFLLALLALILLPVRLVLIKLKRKKGYVKSDIDRVIVIGLDGMDPSTVEELMEQGHLKNFSKLKEMGSYHRLQTTTPSISPVAWSSFITGVNPGRHNIFDFLSRDRKTYLPYLSSAHIGGPSRTLSLGKYVIPLGRPQIKLLRKGKPFWNILGEKGISSSILRVPITFPPEKFAGRVLSAMGVPDLRGSQGTFSYYTTSQDELEGHTEGRFFKVEIVENKIRTFIEGPENPILKKRTEIKLPLFITIYKDSEEVELEVSGQKLRLKKGQYSPWVRLTFKLGLGMKVYGICRFYLKSIFPEFGLYLSPINIDPENPALPISYPFIYSIYLAKVIGSYTTLGLAEDTWALNEGALDEKAFLEQAYLIHEEREKMLFHELEKIRKGLCVCVFDTTDRIQHMFWKYWKKESMEGREYGSIGESPLHPHTSILPHFHTPPPPYSHTPPLSHSLTGVIPDLYKRMDDLLGRVMEKVDEKTLLLVMSDHGFSRFQRGVNLNTWLYQNGYLFLEENTGSRGNDWLRRVDWSRTKAYALGLAGLYINLKGREAMGIVKPGREFEELKKELSMKLTGLKDEETGEVAIRRVYDSREVYSGPYMENAPDLIIGYNKGYRASWESVTGRLDEQVFKNNEKAWGGDHCMDPQLVPGVLFCNRPVRTTSPHIVDIAPTILKSLGVEVPPYFDGKSLF
ncbi:MAG TPA: alkaline phosphatase family protein [Candidatus Limnocylindrales bacterium]|nr:alkaline phosphatase family protein [Candidatus Limnocylindrales bacterium]